MAMVSAIVTDWLTIAAAAPLAADQTRFLW
jgi:hypothetical protein